MRKIFLIFVSISIFILCISIISGIRLPTIGGDSDQWGSILNEFLNVSFNESGELRNDTISTNQIINGTITDADISDTTNLTLGDKITFALGEIIDNLVDGFIKITGNLRVEGIANFSGTIYINNATDVSIWMYNETIATFNLYNSTWDNSWVNSYNNTWYNHTLSTFNLYNTTWDESGWVLGEINTTSNIKGLLQNQINASELSDTINLDANLNWLGNYNFSINNTDLFVNPGLGRVGIGTSTPTGTLSINSSNALGSLRVYNTTGSEHLFINGSSGNVGIGTSSPTGKFHIVGSAGTGGILINGTLPGGITVPSTSAIDDNAGNLRLISFGPDATTQGNITFVTAESDSGGWNERMRITSGGNVGIGTSSPLTKLMIVGADDNINGQLRVNSTGNDARMSFYNSDGASATGRGDILMSKTAGYEGLRFMINGGDKMILDENGNVGIGITSPGAKLDMAGTDVIGIRYLKSGSKDARITIGDPTKTWSWAVGAGVAGDLSLIEEGIGGGDRIYVKQGGNVGIGTATPGAYRLYLAGGEAYCDQTTCWNDASSKEMKENITKVSDPSQYVAQIKNLSLYTFKLNESYYAEKNKTIADNKLQLGFMAEEVPEQCRVYDENNKTIGLNYGCITIFQTALIQEQQAQIEMLKTELCSKDKTYSWCK